MGTLPAQRCRRHAGFGIQEGGSRWDRACAHAARFDRSLSTAFLRKRCQDQSGSEPWVRTLAASDSPFWKSRDSIEWFRLSTEFISREFYGNAASIGSYNRAKNVQRKRANAANENRPLDHDPHRSTGRHFGRGCYQYAMAADVYRLARALG